MLFRQVISSQSFAKWMWQDKENRQLLWFSVVVVILLFGWLKYVYPYPNFMPPDSYNYLEAAYNNDFINIWPIGYSIFLRLVGVFTRSHLALVILQYLFLQITVLYFLFTIRYFLSPGKWSFRVVLVISIANPLLPHIANFVSSDSLFASLSLLWFTQLLWILYHPDKKLLIIHAVVLLLTLTVRFTALYYPFVSITIILLGDMKSKRMWLGISLIVGLILAFIGGTQHEYKVRTDTIQYSAFGGWQIAANALYGYAYSDTISVAEAPSNLRELHSMVNRHMDSIRHLAKRPDKELGVYYLWDFKSPLVLNFHKHWPKNKKVKYFEQWAKFGPLYSKYGCWLIAQNPSSFLKHYAWPNLLKYYGPPAFFMGKYNMGHRNVEQIAVTWFNWKTNQLPGRFKDREIDIMHFFPNLLAIINPSFVIIAIFFIAFGGLKQCSKISKQTLCCLMFVWFTNTFFSVFSAPIELRYQIFPVIVTMPFCMLMFAWIVESLEADPGKNKKQTMQLSETSFYKHIGNI